jgi:hypothetical protein
MWLWKARPLPTVGTAAVGRKEAERWRPKKPERLASEDRDICFATNQEQQRADLKNGGYVTGKYCFARYVKVPPPHPLLLVSSG